MCRLNVGHQGCLPVRAPVRRLCRTPNHVIRLQAEVDRNPRRIWNEAALQFRQPWLVMIPDRLAPLLSRRRCNNNRLVTSWAEAIHFSLDAGPRTGHPSLPDHWPVPSSLAVHRNKPRKDLAEALTTARTRWRICAKHSPESSVTCKQKIKIKRRRGPVDFAQMNLKNVTRISGDVAVESHQESVSNYPPPQESPKQ